MPHALGQCAGWHPGIFTREQCRSCWATKNAPTCRLPATLPPIDPPTRSSAPESIRPPCVHRGPIQSACPLGDTLRDVRHCLCEKTDAGRCWRSPLANTDADVASCERCPHYDPGLPADRLTLTVTHWQRPDALRRLQESIRRYLPTLPVLIEDTGGNLSAGRNKLIGRTTTEFVVVMEEDFVILPETAAGLRDAVSILDHDAGIAGVGGIASEPKRGRVRWGHNFDRRGDVCRVVASNRPMRTTPGGVRYRPCDLVLNWGVFRAATFRAVPWDEDFYITEHMQHYWTASRAGQEFAFYAGLLIDHRRDRPNAAYNAGRRRDLSHLVREKHGFTFHNHA